MAKGVSWKNLADPDPVIDTFTIAESEDVHGIWFNGVNYWITSDTKIRLYRADNSSSTMKLLEEFDVDTAIPTFDKWGGIVGDGVNLYVGYNFQQITAGDPPVVTDITSIFILDKKGTAIESDSGFRTTLTVSITAYSDLAWNGRNLVAMRTIGAPNPDHQYRTFDVSSATEIQRNNRNRNSTGVCFNGEKYILNNAAGRLAVVDEGFAIIQPNSAGGLASARGITMMNGPEHAYIGNKNHYDSNMVAIIHNA